MGTIGKQIIPHKSLKKSHANKLKTDEVLQDRPKHTHIYDTKADKL